MFRCVANFLLSNIAVFPDYSNYFGEYNVIIANKNDAQIYENKIHVVKNHNYPFGYYHTGLKKQIW